MTQYAVIRGQRIPRIGRTLLSNRTLRNIGRKDTCDIRLVERLHSDRAQTAPLCVSTGK